MKNEKLVYLVRYDRVFKTMFESENLQWYIFYWLWDHSLSTNAKFSEKLKFLTCISHVRVLSGGKKC